LIEVAKESSMSDDKPSNTPTDSAAPEAGFTPAPEPPMVDPSEVVPSEVATESADESAQQAAPVMKVVEAAVQEPGPAAKAANDEAQRRLEALSSVVLESAEVATRSAASATELSADLKVVTRQLETLTRRNTMQSRIILGVTGTLLVFGGGLFAVFTASLQARVAQADAMVLAVGKRIVDMNAGLEGIDIMNRTVGELARGLDALNAKQASLEASLAAAAKSSESLVKEVPLQTAKSVGEKSAVLAKEVKALQGQMGAQAKAVASLGAQVKSLKGTVGDVNELKKGVSALVTLQRERYLEALQAQQRAAEAQQRQSQPTAPVNVQFPRRKEAVKSTDESAARAQ
jgi:hypothetical protein